LARRHHIDLPPPTEREGGRTWIRRP
jgi:hypothetical protein